MPRHGGGITGILELSKLVIYLAYSVTLPLSAVPVVQTGSGQGATPLSRSSHLSSSCSQATETRHFCVKSMQLLYKPEPSFKRHKAGDCHNPRHLILMLTIVYLISSKNLSVFIHPVSL